MNIFKKTEQQLKEFEEEVNQKKKEYYDKFLDLKKQKIDVDEELLKEFLKEYWYLKQKSENEWEVIVPRFLDFSVGWLDHTTKGYNVFIIKVNVYIIRDLENGIKNFILILSFFYDGLQFYEF